MVSEDAKLITEKLDRLADLLVERSRDIKAIPEEHVAVPMKVTCPECEESFEICKDCGGNIKPKEEED